jgi:hypothetical protein
MVFYCEQATGFASDVGYQDETYFVALVRMFEQTAATANSLPTDTRDALIARLDRVRSISHKCGYGVGDDMDSILAKTPSARTVPPSADNPDSSSEITLHERLPEIQWHSCVRLSAFGFDRKTRPGVGNPKEFPRRCHCVVRSSPPMQGVEGIVGVADDGSYRPGS